MRLAWIGLFDVIWLYLAWLINREAKNYFKQLPSVAHILCRIPAERGPPDWPACGQSSTSMEAVWAPKSMSKGFPGCGQSSKWLLESIILEGTSLSIHYPLFGALFGCRHKKRWQTLGLSVPNHGQVVGIFSSYCEAKSQMSPRRPVMTVAMKVRSYIKLLWHLWHTVAMKSVEIYVTKQCRQLSCRLLFRPSPGTGSPDSPSMAWIFNAVCTVEHRGIGGKVGDFVLTLDSSWFIYDFVEVCWVIEDDENAERSRWSRCRIPICDLLFDRNTPAFAIRKVLVTVFKKAQLQTMEWLEWKEVWFSMVQLPRHFMRTTLLSPTETHKKAVLWVSYVEHHTSFPFKSTVPCWLQWV